MNIIEGLAGHAHDLAQSVGGKQPVEVWAWVSLTPDQPLDVNCHCVIGKTGSEVARGAASTIEAAFVKCIDEWKKKGAYTDARDAEVKRLQERAEKIGYMLMPVNSATV